MDIPPDECYGVTREESQTDGKYANMSRRYDCQCSCPELNHTGGIDPRAAPRTPATPIADKTANTLNVPPIHLTVAATLVCQLGC